MKKMLVTIACFFSLLMVSNFTIAVPKSSVAHAAGITDSIKSNSGDSVVQQVNTSGDQVIKIIRQVSIVIMFIMIAWIGFTKYFSGSAQSLADMKVRLGILVIALLFAFKTEMVTGTLLKVFGVDISSL